MSDGSPLPSPLRGEGARRADEGFSLSADALLQHCVKAAPPNPSTGAARHPPARALPSSGLPSGEKVTGAPAHV